jgi:hypothetical protein
MDLRTPRAADARRRYGWATIAARVASLYQEVVAQRASGGVETRIRRDRAGG